MGKNKGTRDKKDKKKKNAEGLKPIEQNTSVFTEEWMNNCYKEVIYPDPSCTKVTPKRDFDVLLNKNNH